jgi:hypothetical protein
MDLMFDTQVLTHRGTDELPESVLGSISDYYRRATTTSRPMSYLIAVVMLILLSALGCRWAAGHDAIWLLAASTVVAGTPILLALARTVPNAVQLGGRAGSPAELSRLARSICRDHLLCLTCMCLFLAISLSAA